MQLIQVVVQDENGKPVTDLTDLSAHCLPGANDERFVLLRFVDPYGDTVFNCLQVPHLLRDLEVLEGLTTDKAVHDQIAQLKTMCQVCLATPHLYVKFIGD
jgi:hypothetical protein